jgi:molybdopterin molybdotransferase
MQSRGAPAPLMPLAEALAALLAHAKPLGRVERVATFDADGRVLASDVVSNLDVPAFDNSAMDGYALRFADVQPEVDLPVTQRVAAGSTAQPLVAGQAARIFTGAPLPPGADTVVMQEDCEVQSSLEPGAFPTLRVRGKAQAGQWVRARGDDVKAGQRVLQAGDRLGPAQLGLAASLGLAHLEVSQRPKVALFSTGDELVMPGECAPENLPAGAIFNSNRFFLRQLLQRLGATVQDMGIVPDNRAATETALRQAAQHNDLILTSGGVSVGEEDHIKPAVSTLGQLDLWQIAIKPGKPFAYGMVRRDNATAPCHFIGLPGNPVSSFVTFLLLVRPFVSALQGLTHHAPRALTGIANFDWPKADKRQEFLRARLNDQGLLDLFPNQSSGVLTSLVWGNVLIDNPPARTIAKGDTVRFYSIADLLA